MTPSLYRMKSELAGPVRPLHVTQALLETKPVISPQQAAADKRYFLKKHGNTAAPEELDADLAVVQNQELQAKVAELRRAGFSWQKIGRQLEIDRERAHALVDPVFAAKWRKRKKLTQRRHLARRVAA